MEQGIELTNIGICRNCAEAELELHDFDGYMGAKNWSVSCFHKDACRRAFDQGYGEGRKQAIMTINGYMTEIEARKLYEARTTNTRP